MANKPAYSAKDVAEALIAAHGIKTVAAKRVGCSVDTVDRYIATMPTVAAAYEQARGGIVDAAESVLLGRLQNREWDAAKFVLTTIGKDRGWGQSVDVHHVIDREVKRVAAERGVPERVIREQLDMMLTEEPA